MNCEHRNANRYSGGYVYQGMRITRCEDCGARLESKATERASRKGPALHYYHAYPALSRVLDEAKGRR